MSGRCVAGLEIVNGRVTSWIRPVSSRDNEELAIEDRRYQNGRDVQVLDVIDIVFAEPRPHGCQQENHLIDDTYYWVQVGTHAVADLVRAALTQGPLWVDGEHSYSGINDRIAVDVAERLPSSLLLVAPDGVTFSVHPGYKKRQVRIEFTLGRTRYNFSVTDPRLEAEYMNREDGEYAIHRQHVICVSLGEPFDGFRYKLAAGVIPVA
jgi:hypothetical protein